jgi:hypothetical protein
MYHKLCYHKKIGFDPKAMGVGDFLVGVPHFGFYMIIVIWLKTSRDKWSYVLLHPIKTRFFFTLGIHLAQWYYLKNKRLFMKT